MLQFCITFHRNLSNINLNSMQSLSYYRKQSFLNISSLYYFCIRTLTVFTHILFTNFQNRLHKSILTFQYSGVRLGYARYVALTHSTILFCLPRHAATVVANLGPQFHGFVPREFVVSTPASLLQLERKSPRVSGKGKKRENCSLSGFAATGASIQQQRQEARRL